MTRDRDFEAFKEAWESYPSQDNEGYVPDRAGFKAGWFAALRYARANPTPPAGKNIENLNPTPPAPEGMRERVGAITQELFNRTPLLSVSVAVDKAESQILALVAQVRASALEEALREIERMKNKYSDADTLPDGCLYNGHDVKRLIMAIRALAQKDGENG